MFFRIYSRPRRLMFLQIALAALWANSVMAANTEERLTALEQRLARLEASLERLAQAMSKEALADQLQKAKNETQSLTQEIESTKTDSRTQAQSAYAGNGCLSHLHGCPD